MNKEKPTRKRIQIGHLRSPASKIQKLRAYRPRLRSSKGKACAPGLTRFRKAS